MSKRDHNSSKESKVVVSTTGAVIILFLIAAIFFSLSNIMREFITEAAGRKYSKTMEVVSIDENLERPLLNCDRSKADVGEAVTCMIAYANYSCEDLELVMDWGDNHKETLKSCHEKISHVYERSGGYILSARFKSEKGVGKAREFMVDVTSYIPTAPAAPYIVDRGEGKTTQISEDRVEFLQKKDGDNYIEIALSTRCHILHIDVNGEERDILINNPDITYFDKVSEKHRHERTYWCESKDEIQGARTWVVINNPTPSAVN